MRTARRESDARRSDPISRSVKDMGALTLSRRWVYSSRRGGRCDSRVVPNPAGPHLFQLLFDRHVADDAADRRGYDPLTTEVVMTNRSGAVLLWAPRVLGIGVCLFLSLFALDAFSGDKPAVEAVRDFLIHLSPMFLLLLVVALSWRWE